MNISQTLPSGGRSIRFALRNTKPLSLLVLSLGLVFSPAEKAQAADGTWTSTTSATWNTSNTTPWASGIVANGSGFNANFTNDIPAGTLTVTLSSPLTIGNVTFSDANITTAGNWTLTGSTLTLAGTTPTITADPLGTNALARIDSAISGTSGLTKAGTGILLLAGTNNYTGGTTVSAGTLRAATSSSLSTGAVTVLSGAALQLQNTITLSNIINLNGSGTSATNRAITLIGGAPILSGPVNLQSNSGIHLGSAASASLEISGNLALGTSTLTVEGSRPLTLSGGISGTGTLNLANISGLTTITTDNSSTFSGQTNVARSTLAIGNNGALGSGILNFGVNDQSSALRSTDTTTRTLNNVFTITGTANSIYVYGSATPSANGDLTFSNTTDIALGGVRRFQVNNRTQFNAGFTGAGGGITMQTGTGTLVLNGTNTYTGATTINAGTMLVKGSLANGAVTVAVGATLGGNGTIGGATTVNGFLTPGDSGVDATDDIAFGNSLTLASTSESIFDINGTTEGGLYDAVDVTGTLGYGGILTLNFGYTPTGGTVFNLFDFASQSGSFTSINITGASGTFDYTNGTFTVVPEPSAALLFAAAGLVFTVRRKRRGN